MFDPVYTLLRHLTLPIVAVTTAAEGERNGMIANSAQRASLVPTHARISLYISKTNYSHDLAYRSGVLGIHLLRQDQWELIWHLGLQSGREVDKLESLAVETGETGCPLLSDVRAAFECRVVNAMDAGAATFFLADVVATREGQDGEVMTSPYFRAHMPPDKQRIYEERLVRAQRELESITGSVERQPWPGAVCGP